MRLSLLGLGWALAAAGAVEPVEVCELTKAPERYHGKRVEVTGFVSRGQEQFVVWETGCPKADGVWLEYGGGRQTGVEFCCGVDSFAGRRTGLVNNARFREFDQLIRQAPDRVARVTLQGRFLARQGEAGYGHFGQFHLLAVEQVMAVEPQTLAGLDYRAGVDRPTVGIGCWVKELPQKTQAELIEEQKQADRGERLWALTDARRVAEETVPGVGLQEKSRTGGRVVFASMDGRREVVVSRPYWLSFSAREASRTAWVVVRAVEIGCE